MRPVEHTSTSAVAQPRPAAVSSHMRNASRRPCSPVAALALPELSTTAAARPSARCAAADLHRRRGREVGGEHAGRGTGAPVDGRDDREVGVARLLDARGEAAGGEPGAGGDAHGMSPIVERPVVSGRPSTRLAFWSAWPDAPFTRLSSAPIASDGVGALVVAHGDVRGVGSERRLGGGRARRPRARTARRRRSRGSASSRRVGRLRPVGAGRA